MLSSFRLNFDLSQIGRRLPLSFSGLYLLALHCPEETWGLFAIQKDGLCTLS